MPTMPIVIHRTFDGVIALFLGVIIVAVIAGSALIDHWVSGSPRDFRMRFAKQGDSLRTLWPTLGELKVKMMRYFYPQINYVVVR